MKPSNPETWIQNYLAWMAENGRSIRTINDHKVILKHFSAFVRDSEWTAEKAVWPENREKFMVECKLIKKSAAMNGFVEFLEKDGILVKTNNAGSLPDVYDQYIIRYRKIRQVNESRTKQIIKILLEFHQWTVKRGVSLQELKIQEVDDFLKIRNQGLAPRTCSDNRGVVKKFLQFLHLEKKLLKSDLSAMIVSAPVFTYAIPPRYLRKTEIQKLFESLQLTTAEGLRISAMTRIAYTTGLRPGEIANMKFDDIAFSRGELTVPERKGFNPAIFPLPEDTVKAIAAYVFGARPESLERRLFLSLSPPHVPVTSGFVADAITNAMRCAGVPGTAYWLRHTYAQNLLESGASIFEIKEMLGHDCLKTTKRYLHIHIKLMREVLFDD